MSKASRKTAKGPSVGLRGATRVLGPRRERPVRKWTAELFAKTAKERLILPDRLGRHGDFGGGKIRQLRVGGRTALAIHRFPNRAEAHLPVQVHDSA